MTCTAVLYKYLSLSHADPNCDLVTIENTEMLRNPYLGDDLQVFEVGPLCGQQFLGYEVSFVCGKLLDTNRKLRWSQQFTSFKLLHTRQSVALPEDSSSFISSF